MVFCCKRCCAHVALGALLAMPILMCGCSSHGARSPSPQAENTISQDASAIAADAYVWGLPLVVTMRMMQRAAPNIGINRLFLRQQLNDPTTDAVPLGNVDFLMASAVLDLRNGPLVLTVPEIKDRYYSFQFLDMYTEAFAYIGTRAMGGEAGSWVIAPPGWDGELPSGDLLTSASTPLVYLLGRFLVASADDLPAARAVMAQVSLEPLTPGQRTPAPSSFGPPPGAPMDSASAGAAFFDELGDILAVNPPTSEVDRAALERFAAIGIGPGFHPAADGTPDSRAALAKGVADGATHLNQEVAASRESANGWTIDRQLGRYSDNFLLRARVAQFGWGANVLEEAVYMLSTGGANGEPYSGARNYVLHFPAGELPPASAFWSLTLYGADLFLFDNPAHRYAIRDLTPGLQTNPDGSLDIYIQQSPPPGHEPNWLPAPAGGFVLEIRIYLPKPSVLDGTYRPPAVTPN